MPDCDHPKCHEKFVLALKDKVSFEAFNKLKDCANKKLPKKSVWAAIPILVILFGFAIGAADFKYAHKSEIESCKKNQATTTAVLENLVDDMKELKQIVMDGLAESRKDTKEILKYLRDKP